ncbi:MAG TPA: DUF362 domain-containing protein [Patescibacteria group bacterium]|nr:DUF362 domain-containing protein [Patescibacteria group bacterium]
MSKVFLAKDINPILDKLDLDKLGQSVGIKVHFGERGCTTYINPKLVRAVYNKVIASGRKVTLIECNVLYKGSRTNSTDHIKTAREHGFTEEIDILDGEQGDEYLDLDSCKVGRGLEKYDSLIILSHVKGHQAAGYGGAIKNLAMGLGSRAGKLDMHSNLKPSITPDCIGCGICARNCDVKAIAIENGQAVIDYNICVGCAMCIAVCPHNAVAVPWGGRTNEELQARMVEYTKAILKFRPQTIYINVLEKVTALCDCIGAEQEPMMADVGILYSNDLMAIERASLDLLDKHSQGAFLGVNEVDKYKQLELAESAGLGNGKYEIIELS